MIFKKYIDEYTLKDLPRNGVITIDIENDKGEIVETRTGVSNLPLAFEKDMALANKNGYYEYVEDDMPVYNEEEQFISYRYEFDGERIVKKWTVNEIVIDEVVE